MERKNRENICINCKRCTNSNEFNCCWADHGAPVAGWTATPGRKYEHFDEDGNLVSSEQGWHITACPLFIKDKEYTTHAEFAAVMSNVLGISLRRVYYAWDKSVASYEKATGKTVPLWARQLNRRGKNRVNTEEDI